MHRPEIFVAAVMTSPTPQQPARINGHGHNGPARNGHAGKQQASDNHRAPSVVEHVERHTPFGVAQNTEIARQEWRQSAKNGGLVAPTRFRAVAEAICKPPNTAAQIAARIGAGERTVERWMSGEPFDPPTKLVVLVLQETFGK